MYKFTIKGVVQGVGFRPYIYNACKKSKLKGYVQNAGTGVVVEVNNNTKLIEIFKHIPPLARIDSYKFEPSNKIFNDFSIKKSKGKGFSEIPPDIFLCRDCCKELNNNRDRRYKYFFLTCTNCGPRFSITKKSPYDRETTTMDNFPMCSQCKTEYTNSFNRRYHAQTIACNKCGPTLDLRYKDKSTEVKLKDDLSLIKKTADLIKKDHIVAIKGIGGFHLACNLKSKTIKKLRRITNRKDKPYAIMCRDLKMAGQLAMLIKKERELLLSIQRPIVVLKKKKVLGDISELDSIGVMLPYTALHYLLFEFLSQPIVMTSSNLSNQPITTKNSEQIADYTLTHNRKIENSIDDSVIKVIEKQPVFLRRSRGFVPQSIEVRTKVKKKILALGAELNNTFAVYKDGRITISQYMGTTSEVKTMEHVKKMINKFLKFIDVKPDIILTDLHPNYNTSVYGTKLAQKLDVPLVKVQHHKAHAYSVATEHNFADFTSIVCDGLGFGEDKTIWGGEVFHNNKRIGHLEPQYQLGGDSATQYPAKMLYAILSRFLSSEEVNMYFNTYLNTYFSNHELNILQKQLDQRFNCPQTTSCGRILDAASFLLGFCDERTYEGRPAMLLEANSTIPYVLNPVVKENILMTTPLFQFLIRNLNKDKQRLAATVQLYLAKGLYEIAAKYSKPIVFSGGCAVNRMMTSYMIKKGVYINHNVPCGDGGISFGQIGYYLANPGYNIT